MSKEIGISGKGFVLFAISLSLMLPAPVMATPPKAEKASFGNYRGIGAHRRVSYSSKNSTKQKTQSSNPFSKLSSQLKKVFGRGESKTDEPKKLPVIAGMSPTKQIRKPVGQSSAKQISQKKVTSEKSQNKTETLNNKLAELYAENGVDIPEDFRTIAAPAPEPMAKSDSKSDSDYKLKRAPTQLKASAFADKPIVVGQTLLPLKRKPAPAKTNVSTPAPRKLEVATSAPAGLKPMPPQPEATKTKTAESVETFVKTETKTISEPKVFNAVDPAFAAAMKAESEIVKEQVSVTITETTQTVETKIEERTTQVEEAASKLTTDVTDQVISAQDAAKKKNEMTVSAVSLHQAYLKPTPVTSNHSDGLKPAYTEAISGEHETNKFAMPVTQVSNSTTPEPQEKLSPNQLKMKRVAERTGQVGFKGFCPVVLRDQRDLEDSSSDHQWSYNGRTYDFSSNEALEQFKKTPHIYAPAFRGSDIVMIREHQLDQQGQLDYATWYRGRLFLFSSAENVKKFRSDPKSFVKK